MAILKLIGVHDCHFSTFRFAYAFYLFCIFGKLFEYFGSLKALIGDYWHESINNFIESYVNEWYSRVIICINRSISGINQVIHGVNRSIPGIIPINGKVRTTCRPPAASCTSGGYRLLGHDDWFARLTSGGGGGPGAPAGPPSH